MGVESTGGRLRFTGGYGRGYRSPRFLRAAADVQLRGAPKVGRVHFLRGLTLEARAGRRDAYQLQPRIWRRAAAPE